MTATVAVVALIGYVILLLWGMHMLQSSVVRAFGSQLRRVIGRRCATVLPPSAPGWL